MQKSERRRERRDDILQTGLCDASTAEDGTGEKGLYIPSRRRKGIHILKGKEKISSVNPERLLTTFTHHAKSPSMHSFDWPFHPFFGLPPAYDNRNPT